MGFSNVSMRRTDRGKALTAQVEAGSAKMLFTRLALGSGFVGSPSAIPGMNKLVSEKLSASVTSVRASGANTIVRGHHVSADVREPFIWKELGLFAKPEGGEEILFCYVCDADSAEVIENNPTMPTVMHRLLLALIDGDVSVVPVSMDAMVTWDEWDAEMNALDGRFIEKVGGDVGDTVVTFAEQPSAAITDIASGAKLSVLIGKIKKLLADLIGFRDRAAGFATAAQGAKADAALPTTALNDLQKEIQPVQVVLGASAWSAYTAPGTEDQWQQTVDVAGLRAVDNFIPGYDPGSKAMWQAANVSALATTVDGKVTFVCVDKPTADITGWVAIVGVNA